MQPSGDVQAHAQPAMAAATAETLSIKIRTHLWISWARIAVNHEATAHAARQEMQPGADQSGLLMDEADAGLDGICAAAFALEALSRELSELGSIPEATLKRIFMPSSLLLLSMLWVPRGRTAAA
jgi:hypothetical protein